MSGKTSRVWFWIDALTWIDSLTEITSKLQILIDKFNDRFISKKHFVTEFLTIHPFLDGNGRKVKILMQC